jgi:hypothetical protein
VKNAFATMGNFIIGIFESIANTYVSMINLVIKGLNLLPGVNIGELGDINLPRFNISSGGTASGAAGTAAGPDRVERMIQVPSIPAIAPVTLPAPSGGGGGGSRGGGGGQMIVQPFDPSVYDPKSRYYEVPAMLDAAYAPKQAVYNVTVNSTIADERLGDTIVNALKQYNRRSGPLDVQIA